MELILPLAAALVAAVIATLIARLSSARQANASLAGEIARQKDALNDTQMLLATTEQKLRDTFQSLAAEALNDNRAAFLDLAKTSFAGFQKPISETLQRVDERLNQTEQARAAAFATLTEQLRTLDTTATTLSRALRTPHVRGQWGEMQLRRVVEIAGMLEWCDFEQQPSLYGDSGRLRPDMVVHLPGQKRIVVDAKAPMEAFLDAQECQDDAARTLKLQAHARQVRDHVTRLGGKAYWDALDGSPDFVVLFLPGETLFSAALQHDLKLVEEALQQRVLLASPITLIALLTTVAHAWRQEALVDNYREVAQLGKEFYDRLARFAGHMDDVRKKLDGAVQAYNEAAGSFESRVLVSARRLKDLKVTTAEELPPADPIDTVPRVLKQVNLMGLPEGVTTGEQDVT